MGAIILLVVGGCIVDHVRRSGGGWNLIRKKASGRKHKTPPAAQEDKTSPAQAAAANIADKPASPVAARQSIPQETIANPVAELPGTNPRKLFSCVVNGAPTQLTEQQIFDAITVDGSGTVSEAELTAQLSLLQWSVSASYIHGVWMVYDVDGDGVLDRMEFSHILVSDSRLQCQFTPRCVWLICWVLCRIAWARRPGKPRA